MKSLLSNQEIKETLKPSMQEACFNDGTPQYCPLISLCHDAVICVISNCIDYLICCKSCEKKSDLKSDTNIYSRINKLLLSWATRLIQKTHWHIIDHLWEQADKSVCLCRLGVPLLSSYTLLYISHVLALFPSRSCANKVIQTRF